MNQERIKRKGIQEKGKKQKVNSVEKKKKTSKPKGENP
jgi:hypothetical protein